MDIEEYARKHPQAAAYIKHDAKLLDNILKESEWASIIDIGCGDGLLIKSLGHEHKKIIAVDMSSIRLGNLDDTYYSVKADACNMPFKDNSIDLVVSTQVIEHVPSDESMIMEIARILSTGGKAYLSTVFKEKWAWYFYRNNGKWMLDPTHQVEYTNNDQLFNYLKKYGLTVVEEKKSPIRYPIFKILDYMGIHLKNIPHIKIPGYYEWEIVLRRNT